MKIFYQGFIDEKFKYVVEVNGHKFDYFTGSGWAEVATKSPEHKELESITSFQKQSYVRKWVALNQGDKQTWLNLQPLSKRNRLEDKYGWNLKVYRKVPSEQDVLECLRTDVEVGTMSFYDFCEGFGYDKDSISALKLHMACMDTAQKLRGFKFPNYEEEIKEA
jgi:hypothetical protein